jgi:hypothetical protein
VSWKSIGPNAPKPGPDWKPGCKWLYICAGQAGWKREQIHLLIEAQFKKHSTKELTFDEYNKVLEWIDTLPPGTISTERDPNTPDMFNE